MLALGKRIAPLLQAGDIVTLTGPLGSGKTMLARGILEGLGHGGEVPSPTFAIVQHYAPPDVPLAVAHADLYRLEDAGEVAELALDEYLVDGAIIVEWPDLLPASWRSQTLNLSLQPVNDGERILTATFGTAWETRWPPT